MATTSWWRARGADSGLRPRPGPRAPRRRACAAAAARARVGAARRGVELETALAVHDQRLAAVEELEANALPLLDENESLARRSYEAGEMGLGELLLVRRETLALRRDHLDRLREAAVAAVAVQASAGVLE